MNQNQELNNTCSNFRMSVGMLKKACEQNNFLIVRYCDGYTMAINCKVHKIAIRRKPREDNQLTSIIGYTPCNFNEYISRKTPFII